MPQLDTTTFVPQLVWLAITFVALYLILGRRLLPRIGEILESRQDKIAHDLAGAESAGKEAKDALAAYEAGLAKALAQGLGSKVKTALETAIKLAPKHADAHIALGAFHAEVIDKVGSLLGRTQGASKDTGLAMYKQALKLTPGSAIAMIEYANGLVTMFGQEKMKDAEKLYAEPVKVNEQNAGNINFVLSTLSMFVNIG